MGIPCIAGTVTWNFAGTASSCQWSCSAGVTTLAGSVTYQTDAADTGANVNGGNYLMDSFNVTVTTSTGDVPLSFHWSGANEAQLNVTNDYSGSDYMDVTGVVTNTNNALSYNRLGYLSLADDTGSALSSNALPLSAPVLTSFPTAHTLTFEIYFPNQYNHARDFLGYDTFNITSLTSGDQADAPEPATTGLVFSGLAGLLWLRRKSARPSTNR